jgi:hypothetical protein
MSIIYTCVFIYVYIAIQYYAKLENQGKLRDHTMQLEK